MQTECVYCFCCLVISSLTPISILNLFICMRASSYAFDLADVFHLSSLLLEKNQFLIFVSIKKQLKLF